MTNRNRLGFVSGLFASMLLASCGKGTITFGGDGDGGSAKVVVRGNLDEVFPVTSRDIVAFVFLADDEVDRCPCPADASASATGKAVVLTSGQLEFSLANLAPGRLSVMFLLDEPGNDADGEIDPGDPIAILDDLDCKLDNVAGNRTVTLTDIDIAFDEAPEAECKNGVPDPPAAGRARARLVTVEKVEGD